MWKVQYKKTKETFALKEMSKLKIIDKKSEKSINSERTFLAKLNHPFIVNMHYAFQDNDNLYLVMDMLSGGDLRYHISRHRKFSEEQTRFFIGCMIIALDYIHANNVIHRDIKPENLVLDEKGYVRITDFGIAKENCPDNSSETSGTPGYMSPEVMKGRNHSFEVDFFAIGVIVYEFMNGKRPYVGRNRREIKEQMIATQAKIKIEDLIPGWSTESADFINQLLIRRPENRLGFTNGAKDLKEHSWLKYYPWKELDNKQLPSPFIPEKKDNFDKRYCESVEHGCAGIDAFGQKFISNDALGLRNFFMRCYKTCHKNGGDMMIHCHLAYTPMTHITDFFAPGENTCQLCRENYRWGYCEGITPMEYQSSYNQYRTGLAFKFILQNGRAVDLTPAMKKTINYSQDVDMTLHSLTPMVVHDISVWGHYAHKPTIDKLWRINREVSLSKATFMPYWRNNIVTTSATRTYASWYKWDNADAPYKVMIAAGNFTRNAQKAALKIDFKRMGIDPAKATFFDLWNNKAITLKELQQYELKGGTFMLIGIK